MNFTTCVLRPKVTLKLYIKHKQECFIRYLNTVHGSGLKKQSVGQVFFLNQLRSVWISDETLFRVFHTASQSIDNSSRNSKQKITEFYDN